MMTMRPKVSFILQYFHHPDNVAPITERLMGYSSGETLWHNDSNSDHAVFEVAMAGVEGDVVVSDNIHEIRGYNMLARRARGEYLVFMQDDDIPPNDVRWVDDCLNEFQSNPQLGMVGVYQGSELFWSALNFSSKVEPDDLINRFMLWVNMGPVVIPRVVFEAVGSFDLTYSPRPGLPGIGFDAEYATRLWTQGLQVRRVSTPNTQFTRFVGGRSSYRSLRSVLVRKYYHRRNRRLYAKQYGGLQVELEESVRQANEDDLRSAPA